MTEYFGKYAKFHAASSEDAAKLLGADNMIGDIYDVDLRMQDGKHRAWLSGRYGDIGYLDEADSQEMALLAAKDMVLKAVLSFVAFTSTDDGGSYWGEVGLICFAKPDEEAFSNFLRGISRLCGDGLRPRLDFGAEGAKKIVDSNGEWLPADRVSMPKPESGMAILKKRRRLMDKAIEQGRTGNKGCYVVSWAFMLAVVTLVVWIVLRFAS